MTDTMFRLNNASQISGANKTIIILYFLLLSTAYLFHLNQPTATNVTQLYKYVLYYKYGLVCSQHNIDS